MEVEAWIEVVAVGVGDVLVFVGQGPGVGAGRVEKLEAGLKIKIEIKLGAAGDVDWAGRCDAMKPAVEAPMIWRRCLRRKFSLRPRGLMPPP